jgi:hypothetical protein
MEAEGSNGPSSSGDMFCRRPFMDATAAAGGEEEELMGGCGGPSAEGPAGRLASLAAATAATIQTD